MSEVAADNEELNIFELCRILYYTFETFPVRRMHAETTGLDLRDSTKQKEKKQLTNVFIYVYAYLTYNTSDKITFAFRAVHRILIYYTRVCVCIY